MRGGGSIKYNMPEFAAELEQAPANQASEQHCGSRTNTFGSGRSARAWTACPLPRARSDLLLDLHRSGKGFQRFPDGTAEAFDFTLGETVFNEITADDPMLHDLENTDEHLLRFVAIELKDL